MAYRQEERPTGRNARELFPAELMEWWYDGEDFGFAVQKVTPIIGDRYPSTLGISRQQVLMSFDMFQVQRHF